MNMTYSYFSFSGTEIRRGVFKQRNAGNALHCFVAFAFAFACKQQTNRIIYSEMQRKSSSLPCVLCSDWKQQTNSHKFPTQILDNFQHRRQLYCDKNDTCANIIKYLNLFTAYPFYICIFVLIYII